MMKLWENFTEYIINNYSDSNKIIEVSKNKNLIKKVIDNLNKDSFDRTGELKKIDKLLEEK